MKDVDITLNVKAISLYELMTDRSFFEMTDNDIIYLLYAVLVTNNRSYRIPFTSFLELTGNQRIMSSMMKSLEKELKMVQEISTMTAVKEEEKNSQTDSNDTQRITDIADYLIVSRGLDPHYVMYEMGLWELKGLIKAIETESKTQMEDKRFWSYINILPHIDGKKIKSPDKLLPFPWEKEELKNRQQAEFEEKEGLITNFLKKGVDNG